MISSPPYPEEGSENNGLGAAAEASEPALSPSATEPEVSALSGDGQAQGEESDLSWVLIAVGRGRRNIVILDYAPGWEEFEMDFYWEDTFDCDPPSHLAPGAYRWTDYKIGFWHEGYAINATGGVFIAQPASEGSL